MPNIELHGFSSHNQGTQLLEKIQEGAKRLEFADDIVITVKDNEKVQDIRGNNCPYIRIVSSNTDHFSVIRNLLEELGINEDVETLVLGAFYAKKPTTG